MLADLRKGLSFFPDHISFYALTVEEGTPIAARYDASDTAAWEEGWNRGALFLEESGFRRYEISNFARPGKMCLHNLKYWNCDEYLGFGPAAYSDFGGDRFGNSRDLAAYIEGVSIECDRETPTRSQRMNEYVMLRMRLSEGVSATEFQRRFGCDFEDAFGKRLAAYERHGLVERGGDGWHFTRQGFYVSNAILSEILDFSE